MNKFCVHILMLLMNNHCITLVLNTIFLIFSYLIQLFYSLDLPNFVRLIIRSQLLVEACGNCNAEYPALKDVSFVRVEIFL